MFKSVNVFQMVVLVLILVGVVMIFMRQNNTCVTKQNEEGFASWREMRREKKIWREKRWEDHLDAYEHRITYPRHNGSRNNFENFCKAGQNMGKCSNTEFARACSDVCPAPVRRKQSQEKHWGGGRRR